MRKLVKIMHSFAACGLIGGLLAYIVLLSGTAPATPVLIAEQRLAIAALSNYLLLPSMAVALISGLLSMAVHRPFQDKGWVLLKAALGLLMFKGVLTVIGAKADYAADMARRVAEGGAGADVLERTVAYEWYTLFAVLVIAVTNIVLAVWRPAFTRRRPSKVATPSLAGGKGD